MVNKAADNGRAGAASEGSKEVLRAKDIIPPYGDEDAPGPNVRKTKAGKRTVTSSRKTRKQRSSEAAERPFDQEPASGADTHPRNANVRPHKIEVPRFDLDQDIMAEQRRATATRRKGPGRKIAAASKVAMARSVDYAVEKPAQAASEQARIIAEIVARDIEKLCSRSDGWGIHRTM